MPNCKTNQSLLRPAILAAMLLLVLVSCGGSGSMAPAPPAEPQTEPVSGAADGSVAPQETRQVLTLTVPAFVHLEPGSEIDVTLGATFADEVHQGSARILFDPDVFQPVSSELGELLPTGMLSVAGLDQLGHVPFAFTALPDEQGVAPGEGDLLRVRFRLKARPPEDCRIRLQNDMEFLQLRNREGRRLGFELESRGVL